MNKILVIDDESWLRKMIRMALEQQGFEVIEAESAQSGAAQAQEILPDLILCDVNIDKAGDGYHTLAKLREDANTSTIPFILMTGMADNAGMRHGMELGADDYLPKPFKVDELYATVNARLRKVQTVRDEAEKKLILLRSQISLMLPHEMRTPLNGIISNSEMLATSAAALDPKLIVEMSREICQSGQRLEHLIENFLIYAQLEIAASDAASILSLRSARTDNPVEIAQSETVAQSLQAGRKHDLKLNLAGAPLAIASEYFRKIVLELVQNAFKFSPPGTPVRVEMNPNGSKMELAVHDAGRGFTTDQIRRIGAYLQFERKMQDEQGLGLGLSIARRLAELHGGSLDIASTQGEGATVTVQLPQIK